MTPVLFANGASAAYALLAVGALNFSILYLLRRGTLCVQQCLRRDGAGEVKQTSLDDGISGRRLLFPAYFIDPSEEESMNH